MTDYFEYNISFIQALIMLLKEFYNEVVISEEVKVFDR